MGIRVYKNMGWIIEKVDLDNDILSKTSLQQLLDENKNDEQLKLELLPYRGDKSETLEEFVMHINTDFGQENIWLLRPPFSSEDWSRYDNSLDYQEAQGIAETKIMYLHADIFPYRNKFIVTSTLKELTEKNRLICSADINTDNFEIKYKEELIDLGLDLNQSLRVQIHMRAPRILELILEKGNPKLNYLNLKPAIVTHWE